MGVDTAGPLPRPFLLLLCSFWVSRDGLGSDLTFDFSQPSALGTCLRCATNEIDCAGLCIPAGTCCKTDPAAGPACVSPAACTADGGLCQ